jgi:hypothetical protein
VLAITHEVQLDVLNRTRPAVEAEDLVRQIYSLLGSQVGNPRSARTLTMRDVFRAQLAIKTPLKGGNLLCSEFADSGDRLDKRIRNGDVGFARAE